MGKSETLFFYLSLRRQKTSPNKWRNHMKKIEKIQDRLSTTEGFDLKRLIESCRENHISNNLTLDKNMFQKRRETLSDECFIDINDLSILKSCQRDTVTSKRFQKLYKIGKTFSPVKYGRTQLARIEGDENLYIFDGLGRATVAYCLGIQHIPCEITKFKSEAEVLIEFFEQHENEEKLSGWTRIETVYNAPVEMQTGYFKNSHKQTVDIYHALSESKCVYDSFKATENNPSVETSLTRFRECITQTWSGNGSTKAGDRQSYALIKTINMINRLWINEDHYEVHANLLAAIVHYATDGGHYVVTPSNLRKKDNTDILEINKRLQKLETRLRRIAPEDILITQSEFWTHLLNAEDLMNKKVAKEGGNKIKIFCRKNHSLKYEERIANNRTVYGFKY